MHHFQGEPGRRKSTAPARKLWTVLQALDGYLTGQSDWTVRYAQRHRAGLRVGTAITEGTANFLVNRRMNKSQQMRWRGAAPISSCRFAMPSITARSVPASDRNSIPPTIHPRQSRSPPDPQFCGSPRRRSVSASFPCLWRMTSCWTLPVPQLIGLRAAHRRRSS